jgi:hypothetical protein
MQECWHDACQCEERGSKSSARQSSSEQGGVRRLEHQSRWKDQQFSDIIRQSDIGKCPKQYRETGGVRNYKSMAALVKASNLTMGLLQVRHTRFHAFVFFAGPCVR